MERDSSAPAALPCRCRCRSAQHLLAARGIVCRPHAALQPANPFGRVPLQPPQLRVNAPCKLEQDSLSSSCEEVTGSQLPSPLVHQGSRPGLGSAGPWHSLLRC